MHKLGLTVCVVTALVMVVLVSPVASAQSTISGVVRDASGAVMPASEWKRPAPRSLKGSRIATTSRDGRYAIVDVRPGTYTMTFAMEGFASLRQQVEVLANVTVPVDANMQVGPIGQTVEVQEQLATVDVETVAHPEVLTRTDIDSVPTARNLQSIASYIPGVHLNVPDVGGSQQIQQTFMATHGNATRRSAPTR